MAEKKHEQSSFTVTDRRLFTSDGELRSDAPEQEVEVRTPTPSSPTPAAAAEPIAPPIVATDSATPEDREMPVPPVVTTRGTAFAAVRSASSIAFRSSATKRRSFTSNPCVANSVAIAGPERSVRSPLQQESLTVITATSVIFLIVGPMVTW